MSKALKKQQEEKQKELQAKVELFSKEYKELTKKHGFKYVALLGSNEQSLFAQLRIVHQENKEESK